MSLEPLVDAIQAAMEEIAPEIGQDIRDSIAEAYPPPSAPGTSPHRRTGNLQALVSEAVESESADVAKLTVTSAAHYSSYLDNGTSRMAARPFMAVKQAEWTDRVIERISERIESSDTI